VLLEIYAKNYDKLRVLGNGQQDMSGLKADMATLQHLVAKQSLKIEKLRTAKDDQFAELSQQIKNLQDRLALVTEATRELSADRNRLLQDPDVRSLLEKKRATEEWKGKADQS